MYVIKHVPEDFFVSEVSTVRALSSGKYSYFVLLKRNVTTLEALRRLAVALRVSFGGLSCAGNKDKKAVTGQVCSVYGGSKDRLESLNLKDINCRFLGFGDEPVHLGQLEGNAFKIVVRNIDSIPEISTKFRNLFGEQRFSVNNAHIGRHIVKREFEPAVKLISGLHPEIVAKMKLHVDKRDFVGALRCLPRKLLLLFVHAYQSLLWNKIALASSAEILPIIGFGTEVDDSMRGILAEERLKPSDFVIRELPEASAEGSERKVWAEAKDLKVGSLENDEFFVGKKKVTLEFFLPKGSYATEFIRQSFL
jgi:tRNA pseudouridine13 synthase